MNTMPPDLAQITLNSPKSPSRVRPSRQVLREFKSMCHKSIYSIENIIRVSPPIQSEYEITGKESDLIFCDSYESPFAVFCFKYRTRAWRPRSSDTFR